MEDSKKERDVSRNACKLCTPFGACLAYKGIKGSMSLLHGSQGCATYIRRYMISHYREPIDIASSNFTEDTAIFGGGRNFATAVDNVIRQYNPELVGIATTCLSETIGDDIKMLVHMYRKERKNAELPAIVNVSTPSYSGTHADGFYATTKAIAGLAEKTGFMSSSINVFPGMISPADLRYLKEILRDFSDRYILFPDYSDTLDGPSWDEYRPIPEGGTSIETVKHAGDSLGSVELYACVSDKDSAGVYLEETHGVKNYRLGMPIGIRKTDIFIDTLEKLSGKPAPEWLAAERGRLVDSYVDAHKYIFGKKAVVFGDEDIVCGIVSLLGEIGITTVAVVSGGKSGKLRSEIMNCGDTGSKEAMILDNSDFEDMAEAIEKLKPDMFIGNSKGYMLSRKLKVPLIRVGFPIHDRFGGARVQHIGYRGTQALFDRIVNAVIEKRQHDGEWGYTYM